MDILKTRRQKWLDLQSGAWAYDYLKLAIPNDKKRLEKDGLIPEAVADFLDSIASNKLELLILRYTAGEPVSELTGAIPDLIDAMDAARSYELKLGKPPTEVFKYDLTYIEGYVMVLWLLSLSTLLGHREEASRIIGWIDAIEATGDPNRGRDGLFEFLAQALTGTHVESGRVLLHAEAYRPLARAIVAEPVERPALVKEFLDGWYKAMKPCYWRGLHTSSPRSFFGYWAFEAALVTYLYDIDDASYRNHKYYPKDLIDYARGLQSPVAARTPSVAGGQPCPQTGWWFTPAESHGARRHFAKGTTLPVIEGSAYGATFWQWAPDQSPPKL